MSKKFNSKCTHAQNQRVGIDPPPPTPGMFFLDPHMAHPIYFNLMIHCVYIILIFIVHFVGKNITWTFNEWKPFLFTYSPSLTFGALIFICVPSTHPTTFGNPETQILHLRQILTFIMFLHLPHIFDLRRKYTKWFDQKSTVAFENESKKMHQELLFTQTIQVMIPLTIYIINWDFIICML